MGKCIVFAASLIAALCLCLGNPLAVRGNTSIEKLCYMLESKEDSERSFAVDELVRTGRPAVPALIDVLGKGQIFLARQGAAEALGRIGDPRAVKPLLRALDDPMYFVKEKSLIALGQIGDTSAVPGIIEALKKGNVYFKRVGAETLGNLKDKRSISYLKELSRDSDRDLSEKAHESLLKLGAGM